MRLTGFAQAKQRLFVEKNRTEDGNKRKTRTAGTRNKLGKKKKKERA